MAVKCVLRKASGVLGNEGLIFPEVAQYSRIDAGSFVDYVVENCQVGRAQVLSVLAAVEEQLTMFLMQGHSVEVPNIGTFSLTVNGRAERDGKGHWKLRDAQLGRVALKPAVRLLKELKQTKFELTGGMVPNNSVFTEEQALNVARKLCERDGFFTVQSYREATDNSLWFVRKGIKALVDEGFITATHSGRTVIYRMAADE